MKSFHSIHAHYRANLIELQADYAALEANPPQPRDIHLRVSCLSPEQAADGLHDREGIPADECGSKGVFAGQNVPRGSLKSPQPQDV